MAYGKSTTVGELFELRRKAMREIDVFKYGKRSVARKFLNDLLEMQGEAEDAELQEKYLAATFRKEVPSDLEKFWKYIEEQYLELDAEPSIKFVELAHMVHNDLASVGGLLKYIRDELDDLERKKANVGRLTPDERYYRNQLEYFERKNLQAKDEIVDFMSNDIKSFAIRKATRQRYRFLNFGMSFFGDSPYAYGRRMAWSFSDPYDPRSLTIFSNKFMDLPVGSHRDIVEECGDDPIKFKEFALVYINGVANELPSVREKIEALVAKSHLLASRKQVIQSMLKHFDEKDYISFVSMAPLQIEGIFADICREVGVSEKELDISSLNEKLSHIDGKLRSFFFFEYYSFKFPVLRNLVAHGGLVDGELEDTAIHLLLDLLPVCELTVSEDLPVVNALKILDKASQGKAEELIRWLDLRGSIKIPEFYNIQEKIALAEGFYKSDGFWTHLTEEIKRVKTLDGIKNCEPVKIAGKIKSNELATEEAERFLKNFWKIAKESIEKRDQMLEMVRQHMNLGEEKEESSSS